MLENILYLQEHSQICINKEFYNLDNFYNFIKTKTNKTIFTLNELIQYLKNNTNSKLKKNNLKYNLKYNDYFVLYDNKIISNNIKISFCSQRNINYINNCNYSNSNSNGSDNINIYNFEIIEKQKGGDGSLIDAFMSIIDIGGFFLKIGELIEWLIKFIAWFINFILWVLTDLLNFSNLLNDFFQSLMILVLAICRLPFDLILSLFTLGINTLGGWMQGFWGWDMSSLTKNDKNSNYFKTFNRQKGQKTYLTNTNTVPFSVILGTILCPPMGVFMDMGTSGWLNILICCLLTLLFYLPGLCYALLIIYS
jgi:uncharacterized membrane protein YqaE (UPF0057 family)